MFIYFLFLIIFGEDMKIVIGIDPGVTTGIAIFNLNGKLEEVFSKKAMSKAEIVRFILSRGSPLIIATDKKRAPKMLEEIASALSIPVFSPEEDLKVKEKVSLVKDIKVKNSHERDAVAAGVYFFKKYSKKFREIDNILEKMNMQNHAEKVKELLIKGKAKNLSEAIESVLGKGVKVEKPEKKKRKAVSKRGENEKIKELERKLEISQEYIKKLEKRVKDLEEQKKMLLEERLKESKEMRENALKNKEIELRDSIIRNLKIELEKERALRKQLEEKLEILEEERVIEARGYIPVIRIPEFSRESIVLAKEKFRIFNRVLLFETSCHGVTAAKYLSTLRPKVVIGDFGEKEKQILEEAGIIVIEKAFLREIEKFKNFYGIDKGIFQEILKKEKKKGLMEWLEKHRKRFL